MSYQEQTTTDQTVATTRDERMATHSLAETLDAEPSLGRFAEMLRATGLNRGLQDGEWITVLAPQDEALASSAGGSEPEPFLRSHIIQGALTLDEIRRAGRLRTKEGGDLPVHVSGDEVRVGNARIVRADIHCTNGVIHVIDAAVQ